MHATCIRIVRPRLNAAARLGPIMLKKKPADGFGPEDTRDTTAFPVIMAVTFGLDCPAYAVRERVSRVGMKRHGRSMRRTAVQD